MRRGIKPVVAALVCAALAVPAAEARVRQSGSVLPPGQSGFVPATGVPSGTGSPHLTDQTKLFVEFGFKDYGFNQAGATVTPKPGVKIVRDTKYGVPAVTGETSADAWFGAGYAAAEDRLFQLELFRRATRGRLAEILGEEYLEMDITTRRDFYTDAELDQQLAKLPAELRGRFDAYRDGINAYIAKTRTDPTLMPGEFAAVGQPQGPADWEVRDSAAIGVFLARTVPSDDGEEMNNLKALRALGAANFDRMLPIRVKGQVPTVPPAAGAFPSQPGRTRAQERAAFAATQRWQGSIAIPPEKPEAAAAEAAQKAVGIGRPGGSNMWAIQSEGNTATLFNGPQLGFQIPELFIELEIHAPGLNVRGATAPGVPVLGLGHNENVAWGITSGLTDDDDLYVEKLTGEERYQYKGEERTMECRNERFDYRPPPTALLGADPSEAGAGSKTERLCRTVHGPVQDRAGGNAFARRYAIWGREVESLEGLAIVNAAKNLDEVEQGVAKLTWNENLMAADDQGNIGYWHPGLLPIKPRGFDERLPYPGTGEAEWRGFLSVAQRPNVVNPPEGYLSNWNNVPSTGWTQGDAPARERLSGAFHRAQWLKRIVRRAKRRGGGYEETKDVDKITGTHVQARWPAHRRLKLAREGATGNAAVVLDTILGWNGSYGTIRSQQDQTVHPGVATWLTFTEEALKVRLGSINEASADLVEGGQSRSHEFDITNLQAWALRELSPAAYRQVAEVTFNKLQTRFGSQDPEKWRAGLKFYKPTAQGAGKFPEPFPFFDRGTFQQVIELGP